MNAKVVVPPDDIFDEPALPAEPVSAKRLRPEMSIAEFAASAPEPKKKAFRASKSFVEKARAEMERRRDSGDWEGARGAVLVALFAWLHEQVYGIAADLDAKSYAAAGSCAQRMVDREFGGDYGKAVVFMRWAWRREDGQEKWRRENKREGRRLGWRFQFCFAELVTDYRLHCARTAAAPEVSK